MKILVINGPNLNMLGIREKNLYGSETYDSLISMVEDHCLSKGIEVDFYQSNHEGDLVDKIQDAYQKADGIVINPGAYTHTSIAILDALKTVEIPTVEVHITDIDNREEFRKISYVSYVAKKRIIGHGLKGYIEAVDYLLENK
ncbi:MAG: type II 3-dehydroquinate dehydratase [Erysipelotrichaceae bacterium]|nr:type II 3-dehydroquinate dehydratase [Erysipelotrichaceae bacterium]